MIRVDRGWLDRREINTVVFDPERIAVEEMEQALQKADTYLETVSPEEMDGQGQ